MFLIDHCNNAPDMNDTCLSSGSPHKVVLRGDISREVSDVLDAVAKADRISRMEQVRADIYNGALKNSFNDTKKAKQVTDAAMTDLGYSQPTSAASPNPVPAADKREVGKTYQTPKGAMVWRGNGWAPAQ